MMYALIEQFPSQLLEGLNAKISIRFEDREIRNILVAGMGGSGIGADFTATWVQPACRVPFQVVKDYEIPEYVNEHTLLIASSYSGNTEETLSACTLAHKKGARIIALTSGGKLREMALENNWDLIGLPSNIPAPRAALGYSLVAQLRILHRFGFIEESVWEQLKAGASMLQANRENMQKEARKLAYHFRGKTPVIYTTRPLEPVAVRFRQQLAENSKMLSWHHVLPEMNHNELVGWHGDQPQLAAIFLRHSHEQSRHQLRLEITKEEVGKLAGSQFEIQGRGEGLITQSIYLVHLLDWVSYYLAELNGVDVMAIEIIDYLKEQLGKENEVCLGAAEATH